MFFHSLGLCFCGSLKMTPCPHPYCQYLYLWKDSTPKTQPRYCLLYKTSSFTDVIDVFLLCTFFALFELQVQFDLVSCFGTDCHGVDFCLFFLFPSLHFLFLFLKYFGRLLLFAYLFYTLPHFIVLNRQLVLPSNYKKALYIRWLF